MSNLRIVLKNLILKYSLHICKKFLIFQLEIYWCVHLIRKKSNLPFLQMNRLELWHGRSCHASWELWNTSERQCSSSLALFGSPQYQSVKVIKFWLSDHIQTPSSCLSVPSNQYPINGFTTVFKNCISFVYVSFESMLSLRSPLVVGGVRVAYSSVYICCVMCTIVCLFVFFIFSHGFVSLLSIYEFDCLSGNFRPIFFELSK